MENNNKFPAEVLAHIMSYLPSKDKTNSLRVCRTWHQHISQLSWFDTLSLSLGNYNRFREVQDFFTVNPHLSQQIKHLSLFGSGIFKYDILSQSILVDFPRLFSNVSTFKCLEEAVTSEFMPMDPSVFNRVREAHPGKWNQLESLTDQPLKLDISGCLLGSSATFPHLKGLNVSFESVFVCGFYKVSIFKDLIKALQHTPMLERFALQYTRHVDILDLEKIHEVLPALKHLEIIHAEAATNVSREGININPAN